MNINLTNLEREVFNLWKAIREDRFDQDDNWTRTRCILPIAIQAAKDEGRAKQEEVAQQEVWNLIEKVLTNPAIKNLYSWIDENGDRYWSVDWTEGGFTSGETVKYTIKSAAREVGILDDY